MRIVISLSYVYVVCVADVGCSCHKICRVFTRRLIPYLDVCTVTAFVDAPVQECNYYLKQNKIYTTRLRCQCSADCKTGNQIRTVACRTYSGQFSTACSAETRPPHIRECQGLCVNGSNANKSGKYTKYTDRLVKHFYHDRLQSFAALDRQFLSTRRERIVLSSCIFVARVFRKYQYPRKL